MVDSRGQFENWYARSWADEDPRFDTAFAVDDRGQYQWSYVQDAWVVWQAAQASLLAFQTKQKAEAEKGRGHV